MSDESGAPYRRMGIQPCGPGFAMGPISPPLPIVPNDSFMLTRMNIEPGETVEIHADKSEEWAYGARFAPAHFVYAGSKDLWMLGDGKSRVDSIGVIQKDTPCDTYRPTCPTWVNWPMFSCIGVNRLILVVENRGKEIGHFISRMAGNYGGSGTHPGLARY